MTGKELKQYLTDNGVTQSFLAKQCGKTRGYICKVLGSNKEVPASIKLVVLKKWGWE